MLSAKKPLPSRSGWGNDFHKFLIQAHILQTKLFRLDKTLIEKA